MLLLILVALGGFAAGVGAALGGLAFADLVQGYEDALYE